MNDSYSKKKAIEILERALSRKDRETDTRNEVITSGDLEKMAAELNISKTELWQAASEITNTREQNRNDIYPEAVTTRWINGKLAEQDIEHLLSELRIEFGGAKKWDGSPVGLHKIGKTWEYSLKDATILITERENGYHLQVVKQQFFHGNKLETGILAIPAALILGLIPVAAAAEWVHIFAAIFIAAACYFFSFSLVKKFTRRKRSETVSKLLRITELAEQKLKKMTGVKQIDLEPAAQRAPDDVNSPHKTNRDKTKS